MSLQNVFFTANFLQPMLGTMHTPGKSRASITYFLRERTLQREESAVLTRVCVCTIVCMHTCLRAQTFVSVQQCVCTLAYAHKHLCLSESAYAHLLTRTNICVCTTVCMHTCLRAHTFAPVHICVCISVLAYYLLI